MKTKRCDVSTIDVPSLKPASSISKNDELNNGIYKTTNSHVEVQEQKAMEVVNSMVFLNISITCSFANLINIVGHIN